MRFTSIFLHIARNTFRLGINMRVQTPKPTKLRLAKSRRPAINHSSQWVTGSPLSVLQEYGKMFSRPSHVLLVSMTFVKPEFISRRRGLNFVQSDPFSTNLVECHGKLLHALRAKTPSRPRRLWYGFCRCRHTNLSPGLFPGLRAWRLRNAAANPLLESMLSWRVYEVFVWR